MLKRLVARLKKTKNSSLSSKKAPRDRKGGPATKGNSSLPFSIIPRQEHEVSRKQLSDNALKVLYRLKKSGFDAYLVGGGIRDTLLGQKPKDFDVVTNAKPEQVKALFGNSRLIGRRFKLVHVVFGREVIEVATFRASPSETSQHHAQSAQGMLIRDNVYGNKDEDAERRDFTINALYYSINDFSIHSYFHALDDLKAKQLRMIGDPETRYREDPVRMIRAARFAAKLGFEIEPKTLAPISEMAHLIRNVSPARLYEEVLKLLISGHAVESYRALQVLELLPTLLPATHHELQEQPQWEAFVVQALKNTDERVQVDKPVNPAYLFASLLWPPLQRQRAHFEAEGMPAMPALHQAASALLHSQQAYTAIPKRFVSVIKEIWDLQLRLVNCSPKKADKLIEHPKFRAGYDFLLMREQVGEDLGGAGAWWTDFLAASPKAQAIFEHRQKHSQYPARRPYQPNEDEHTPSPKGPRRSPKRKSHNARRKKTTHQGASKHTPQ